MNIGRMHVLMNMWRGLYKVLEGDLKESAEQLGLTVSEQHLVWIIFHEKELTVTALSELSLLNISTVTQVLKRLQNKGFIVLNKYPQDRRVSYIALTENGALVADKILKQQDDYRVLGYFDKAEEDLLLKMTKLQSEMNRYYHGDRFVNWVEKTKRSIDSSRM
ncbi:MarR family winged helix-turn-helix transcriptional regulator [Alkalihalobacillus sp. AL-G]|uniref:MarR family winged helix-turn-helix transcriptional regulator n=1 Tax=Alkalihalobacillus sp. AL-G TaxID=2926399 RepID=UPI00272AEA7D|nr:MarR family transcriptional regulator [Alkalihalobacillus sp. AL-G]WLD94228.1 MarR family transcriptional regulator [Alkalihalobacillus sp. AL-G]